MRTGLERLKRWLEPQGQDAAAPMKHTLELAAATLLVEVMHADHSSEAAERAAIARALANAFALTDEEAAALLELAEQRATEVTSLHEMTSTLNRHYGYEQRVQILESMWQVVFADDRMDKYEEHLVRRVADLLYIRHSDFIQSKHRARAAGRVGGSFQPKSDA